MKRLKGNRYEIDGKIYSITEFDKIKLARNLLRLGLFTVTTLLVLFANFDSEILLGVGLIIAGHRLKVGY